MDRTTRRWARWLLAYDVVSLIVFLSFVQAFFGEGIELLRTEDPTRFHLSLHKPAPGSDLESADVLFSVTKYQRPYLVFLALIALRLIGTRALAPAEWLARYRTRWGRLKPRLAFSLLVLLALVAGAEAALRFRYRRVGPTDPRLIVKNEDGTALRPGTGGKLWGIQVEVNSLGFRGPELPPRGEGPARRTRVLVLGDSFTMGLSLAEEDTWVRRVESALQARGLAVDLVNAAVGGHRTTHEVSDLERHFPTVQPDVVLLVFFMNDALPDWDISPLASHLYRKSFLYRLSYEVYLNLVDPQFEPERFNAYYQDGAPMWEAQKIALERFLELSRELGFRPLVALHPLIKKLDDYPYEPARQFLMRRFAALGLDAFDMTEAFLGKTDHELWLMPSDHHPNEKASEIAADALAPWLEERLRETVE